MNNKVDFALLLYDEFDGAPISDASVRFICADRAVTPIRKHDGYYVFCDMGMDIVPLEIHRPRYQRLDIQIDKNSLASGSPVVKVRLFREYLHTYTDCAWIKFAGVHERELIAFAPHESLRLASATQEDQKISLLGFGAAGLGKRFSLEPKGEESFILEQMLSNGVYKIDKSLSGQYKNGQTLLRAYRSRGRPDGSCYMPVETQHKDTAKATYWNKEKKKWVCVSAMAQV